MKFVNETFGNSTGILKFPDHYVAIAVTVSDVGVVANSEGKKIVPAGTIIGGAGSTNTILGNVATKAVTTNTQGGATTVAGSAVDAEGVLFTDVDVTYGPASGAMIIHGFIDLNKLPAAPVADAVAALKQIKFIK